ncbi:glutamate receptor 2-like [Phlebotomus argentipes]|uniref:glutamate receptor 2-like n=1 Tax=Phlebotomus argentipes TaxID=94469 RepID=UPI00289316D0|nr:glutamate receptor 2-like [Phlebotomus argentipes]
MEQRGFCIILSMLSIINLTNCESKICLGDFLKDFVEHENVPTTISLFDCQKYSIVKIARVTELPIVTNPKDFLDILQDPKARRNDVLNVVDLDCPSARETLAELPPLLLAHPIRWLLLADSASLKDHEGLLEDLPLRLDSDVLLAEVFNSSRLSLDYIFRINPSLTISHEAYGEWDSKVGIRDFRSTRVLSRRRSNLHQTLLTTSIVITNPDSVNHLDDYTDKHIDSITKVNYRTTNIIMDMLNATRKFTVSSSWGIKNQTTGKWDGMLGEVLDGRAEIGGTSLFMTPERVWIIEYLTLTVSTNLAFIFRPPPLSYVANIFYLPFRGTVWIAMFALLALATFIFFFSWRLSIQYKNREEEVPRFSDIVMNAAGAVTQQGAHMEAKIASGRISSFFLFLSMFFLYTSYTANIVALLQSTTTSISTLQDLLDSNMDLGVEDIVYNRHYFSTMTEPVRKTIYDTRIAPPGKKDKFMSLNDGVAGIRRGLFAFFSECAKSYQMIEETFYEHEKCGLMEIKYLFTTDPWLAIAKNSPYKEVMKVSLFKMKEFGVERRVESKLYTRKPVCSGKGQNFGSVRLIDCHMIVTIIISGYILSLFILLLEHLVKRKYFRIPEGLCLF